VIVDCKAFSMADSLAVSAISTPIRSLASEMDFKRSEAFETDSSWTPQSEMFAPALRSASAIAPARTP